MKAAQLVHGIARLYKYRHYVRTFLVLCENPSGAFSGTVRENELDFLKTLILKANTIDGPIIEVGTLFGFTTQYLASWKLPDKQLFTIDNFSWNPIGLPPELHREFTKRALSYVITSVNTQIFVGSSREFYKTYTGKTPAMVFIDAGHKYKEVREDVMWACDMRIPIITGHDYSDEYPGVKRAVDELLSQPISVCGSCWAYITAEYR